VISLVLIIANTTVCTAQETDATYSCVILAKQGELYDLELYSLEDGNRYTIVLAFDYELSIGERLETQEPYIGWYDDPSDTYCINDNSGLLFCTLKFKGLETVLLGEERAKLDVKSDYQVRLVGVHLAELSVDTVIPNSFGIILALCSLVPFFLLAPDAISDLQMHLEIDAASKGVYGRILALLLPLLTVGLTIWLLESLRIFGG
jgi:hypothetical protein